MSKEEIRQLVLEMMEFYLSCQLYMLQITPK